MKRMLIATAIVAVGATAGTVLSQAGPSPEACSNAFATLASSMERVDKYLADEMARLEADELSPPELERRQCDVWGELDTLKSELLRQLEENKALYVACGGQQWYDNQHARWTRDIDGYRASTVDCKVSQN